MLEERPSGSRRIYAATEGVLHDAGERLTTTDLARPPALADSESPRTLTLHFQTPTRIQTREAFAQN